MVMNKKVLFLTLRIFSATGGIEKVCKVVSMALEQLSHSLPFRELKIFSAYDKSNDANDNYITPSFFKGYGQQKIRFILGSIRTGLSMDIVVISHINLLSVGYFIKLLSPKTKIVLYAHGIEVWGPLSGMRKKMLHKCDKIICVSNFTKDKMLQDYKLDEKKISVINNCIDPYLPVADKKEKDNYLCKKYGFADTDIILMTLTRLSSKELYKGYDHVLISLNNLKKQYPNIRYMIVGKYDEAEKKRLDGIIEEYSLQKYVIFTGYIPDIELAKHYCLGDIYVMPSKKEGFGIVFIEAMHYGLPVIAGNKDGSVDALANGKLGILVNPDDQDEINQAIEKIILNREQFVPQPALLHEKFSFQSYKNQLQEMLTGI